MVIKIIMDWADIDLNMLFPTLNEENYDCCFGGDTLYVASVEKLDKIEKILTQCGGSQYICKEITEPPTIENRMVVTWCKEQLQKKKEADFIEEHQPELQAMMANIACIQELMNTPMPNNEKEEGNTIDTTRDTDEA